MKLVVLGLSFSSSWGNGHATTYRALIKGLHQLGHEVTFLERDVPWYAQHRDAASSSFCRLEFYRSLSELVQRQIELWDAGRAQPQMRWWSGPMCRRGWR